MSPPPRINHKKTGLKNTPVGQIELMKVDDEDGEADESQDESAYKHYDENSLPTGRSKSSSDSLDDEEKMLSDKDYI